MALCLGSLAKFGSVPSVSWFCRISPTPFRPDCDFPFTTRFSVRYLAGRGSPYTAMAPADSDERMAPPSLPSPASVSQNQSQSPQETIEKYRKLKRRYAELEEVRVRVISSSWLQEKRRTVLTYRYQESNRDSNRSGDRNVRMREEKEYGSHLLAPVGLQMASY